MSELGTDENPIVYFDEDGGGPPGGGARLSVDGPPHCFGATDVILAWNTDLERREFLRTKGWKV